MKKQSLEGKSARDLFPDIFAHPASEQSDTKPREPAPPKKKTKAPSNKRLRRQPDQSRSDSAPPLPPDVSWLPAGIPAKGLGDDTPAKRALIIFPDEKHRIAVENGLHRMGYMIDSATSVTEAVYMIKRHPYLLVIGHISMVMPRFHEYMQWMVPAQRRMTYYVLVGPELHTLYNLQALSLSANLVISEVDIIYLERILHKGFSDFEQLYQPFLAELQVEFPPLR